MIIVNYEINYCTVKMTLNLSIWTLDRSYRTRYRVEFYLKSQT